MPKLTEDTVDCGVCDDISLLATKIEHEPESTQTNNEIEMEDFLNMEIATCENDTLGEEAASNTNSFKRYSAEEIIISLKRSYNSRFDHQVTLNLQNEMKAHNEKEDKVMKTLLKAVSDAVYWWSLEIAYKGKASCENKDCDQAFKNEVDMLFHWLRCRWTIYYPSFNLWKMNEGKDHILLRKLQMAKERKARWLARQNQESLAGICAADAAVHQDSRARETLEESQARRNANAAAYRFRRAQETWEEAQARRKANAASHRKCRARETLEETQARRNANAAALRKRRAQETLEEAQARRKVNAASLRNRRARETLEETQARRNANAAALRKRRARETLEEAQARRNANAASHRNRRAREALEQSQARRNTDAAFHRKRRARETLKQSQARRNADAAVHRNRRAQEVGVEQHNCEPTNIISQFCNSRNFAAGQPSDGKFTSCSKLQSDAISENVPSQMTAVASESDHGACVTANGAAVDNSCLLLKPDIKFEPDLHENEKQFEEVLLPHSLSEAKQLTASTEDSELCTFSEGATEVGSCLSRTSPLSDHTNTDGFRLKLNQAFLKVIRNLTK